MTAKQPINQITERDIDAFANMPTLSVYQVISTKSAIYPGKGTPLGLAYCSLKLNGEAGELAEHVGKAMRDDAYIPVINEGLAEKPYRVALLDDGKLTEERRRLIIKEVGDVLWYISAICNELGIDLTQAALENLLKLSDRGRRQALQGSGDER